WSINKDRQRPRFSRAAVKLRQGRLNVSGGDEDRALQAPRKWRTVIRHPTMICLINCRFQTYIFDGRPGAEPAGRKHQVYVDPFNIHISDARRRIALAKWIGPPMLMPLVAPHIFFVFRSILISDSKPTLVMAHAHQVRDRPFFILGFVLLKL